jgi:cystathionine beta-lyase/cystathionine gamma-synthase
MSHNTKRTYIVRPRTALLTRGFDPALSQGSARPAVFRSSTYVFPNPEAAERAFAIALGKVEPGDGEHPGLIYSRLSHPNADILEDQIVPLEPRAEAAAVFNSGMAAITTLFLSLCPPDTSVVYTVPLYGGTYHFIRHVLALRGVTDIAVRAGDTDGLRQAVRSARNLKLVFIETPANPTLVMSDIAAAAEAVRYHSVRPILAVDNTLMGPVFQHPLLLNADLAVYSATKYLSGFSDMLAGVILGAKAQVIEELRGMRAILGNILQPDECWLLDGRLPTVNFRMNRQSKNAQHIVEALVHDPRIRRIHYPLLFDGSEQRRIRDAQCRYPGGMFSIQVGSGKQDAFNFLRRLKIIKNAVSLGGVESLACHPATTTHSEMSEVELYDAGITNNLVRISAGVEDWRDLLKDIEQALAGSVDSNPNAGM